MFQSGTSTRAAVVVFLFAAYLAPGLYRWANVFGFLRDAKQTHVDEGSLFVIEDTTQCEDIHEHKGWLFAACEDAAATRFSWFPPLVNFQDPVVAASARGSIHVIDSKTLTSKRLLFENFNGPFVTHGIDVIADADQAGAVYIFAVNHRPHPEYLNAAKAARDSQNTDEPYTKTRKGQSQLEVFRHVLGSSTVKWIRSIQHPLISTPNDIAAIYKSVIYVTNDHHYPEGHLRTVEDVYFGATWSNTLRVQIANMDSKDPQAGIDVSVALTGLHNNNGLGHGPSSNELAIGSAACGKLHLAQVDQESGQLKVTESIYLDSTIDNPVYFKDPYATMGNDSSGYVVGGLSKAATLQQTAQDPAGVDPVVVWLVQPVRQSGGKTTWNKRAIFEDDGTRVRSCSAALLVAIDPAQEGGKKKAWLYVTGFASENMVAVKVDL